MNAFEQVGSGRISWRRAMGRAVVGAATVALAAGTLAVPAEASASPVAAMTGEATGQGTQGIQGIQAKKYYFAAGLLGRNEVPEPGKKVNDRDGIAVAKFRIQGNRFYYFVQWKRTAKPSAFHIHKGKAGTNGPVVIDLLSNGRIRGNTSFGSVAVKDSSLLKGIKSNPKNWYANLHTKQFPDGAVRGQLAKGGRW
ncbi:CHRD domain-containing protein [Streptosporangium sp. NBC_01469]|uniref:CHRD domain-containing protein n=1 Tax=Streptosporangium sp. NBC_01469 TaxID=2903898 RepID=UPI002E2E2F25|nr:CHRD domain-containing protein [Streptosporangium sp. NBC_01469]